MIRSEQKRLVLIGIHRKGEKGFKKRFDNPSKSKIYNEENESNNIDPVQISDSSQIIKIIRD